MKQIGWFYFNLCNWVQWWNDQTSANRTQKWRLLGVPCYISDVWVLLPKNMLPLNFLCEVLYIKKVHLNQLQQLNIILQFLVRFKWLLLVCGITLVLFPVKVNWQRARVLLPNKKQDCLFTPSRVRGRNSGPVVVHVLYVQTGISVTPPWGTSTLVTSTGVAANLQLLIKSWFSVLSPQIDERP